MIDFLKLQTFDLSIIDTLNSNPLLNWQSDVEKMKFDDSEVIVTKKIKEFKGIYFCFYSNRLEIIFKPHYYFNGNLHNANDFKVNDCINILKDVAKRFKIDLAMLKVVNIEFGVNVVSPIDIKDLITYLAYHEKNEFRTDAGLQFSKKSYSSNRNGTANGYKIIKAYAKGIQFPEYADIDTFRFEVKSKKSMYINRLGVHTALDLLNPNVYSEMIEAINSEFKKVLILDCDTNFDGLSLKEQKKIESYNNPMYWYKVKNRSKNRFNENKINYYNLIDKVDDNLKSKLEKIIFDKLETLKKQGDFQDLKKT